MMKKLTVNQTFGNNDIVRILPEFMGEKNVEVITEVDFLTRCYQIGINPHLTSRQVLCTLKALNSLKSKNAIKVKELSTALNKFMKNSDDKERACAEFIE